MTVTASARRERPRAFPAALRLAVALIAAVTVIVVGLAGLFASPASAQTFRRPETRVGAFGPTGGLVVGAHEPVLAGQRRARAPSYDRAAVGSCVAAETVTGGSGSGPWVDDALGAPKAGGAVGQSTPLSCAAACGEMASGGASTQAQLLQKLGEPTNPEALADSLGWKSQGFGSGEQALAQANQGTMIARLQAPMLPGHFVVIDPAADGTFVVRDPWAGGSTYPVSGSWIEQYVSHGVFP